MTSLLYPHTIPGSIAIYVLRVLAGYGTGTRVLMTILICISVFFNFSEKKKKKGGKITDPSPAATQRENRNATRGLDVQEDALSPRAAAGGGPPAPGAMSAAGAPQ